MPHLRFLLLSATGLAGLAWATTTPEPSPAKTTVEPSQTEVAPKTTPQAQGQALPAAAKRFHCRVFATALEEPVDTRDRSSALGRWVVDMELRGWQVAELDFEVGQKPTGYAEGYVHVCLTPQMAPNASD